MFSLMVMSFTLVLEGNAFEAYQTKSTVYFLVFYHRSALNAVSPVPSNVLTVELT